MKKIILLLFVAACSFKPVFSGNSTDIYVAPISGINGIELRNSLNAKFGGMHEENAKYSLNVKLNKPRTQYKAFENAGNAVWQEVKLSASYTLKQGDKVISNGSDSASESYTFVRYLVASNASYNNAVQNTIQQLSEKIGIRVIAEIQKNENK